MSNQKQLLGATLATAAALAFATVPQTTFAAKSTDNVACYGVNACKGQSVCKTAKNACKGLNSCKGQGVVMKTSDECEKLGGSTEEPSA